LSVTGSGLLEVIVALAVAALLAGLVHDATVVTFQILGNTRERARALTVARGRLELLRAAWCGAATVEPPDCPAGFRCQDDRRLLATGSASSEPVFRLGVRVVRSGDTDETLAILALAVPSRGSCW
jgi:hypothetical protein